MSNLPYVPTPQAYKFLSSNNTPYYVPNTQDFYTALKKDILERAIKEIIRTLDEARPNPNYNVIADYFITAIERIRKC